MNKLYFGDNLEVLQEHVDDESIDLVYLDPPFNKKLSFNILYKSPAGADAQRKAFEDTWRWDDSAEAALEAVRATDVSVFNILRSLQDFLGRRDLMAYLVMMSVRLLQLRRVLKPTGSIYLHCDPTASHYLKLVLDGIFGAKRFKNEIIWKRTGTHSSAKRWGPVHDVILFYSRSDKHTWNRPYVPLDERHRSRHYRHVNSEGRRFTHGELTAPGRRNGRSGLSWKGFDVSAIGRHWATTVDKLDELCSEGRIYLPQDGSWPRLIRYEDEGKGGRAIGDTWTDISPINMQAKERIGYPTQKPLALLERLIAASSNEGDVVLDPFCGCGTAVHAAERLHRQWIGIDITYLAIQVIQDRITTWLPRAEYEIEGIPKDEFAAKKLANLNKHDFQDWAVGRVGGQSRGKGRDQGIDGEISFIRSPGTYGRAIVSVKGGRNPGPEPIRSLARVVERESADMGVFICVSEPTPDMRAEAASAGRVDLPGGRRPKIQILTARDLVEGPNLGILTELNTVSAAQEARAAKRRKALATVPEQLRLEPLLSPTAKKIDRGTKGQSTAPVPATNVVNFPDKTNFDKTLSRRLAVAGLIVKELHNERNFGRTKLAKIFYLADKRAALNLDTDYVRQAAGPLDQRALYHKSVGIEALAQKYGLFRPMSRGRMIRYEPLPNLTDVGRLADRHLGDKADDVVQIVQACSDLTTDQVEIIATLYACWNDLLIQKKPVTDEQIVDDLLENWHPKKRRFSNRRLHNGLKWMRDHDLVPAGRGRITSKKGLEDDDIGTQIS